MREQLEGLLERVEVGLIPAKGHQCPRKVWHFHSLVSAVTHYLLVLACLELATTRRPPPQIGGFPLPFLLRPKVLTFDS